MFNDKFCYDVYVFVVYLVSDEIIVFTNCTCMKYEAFNEQTYSLGKNRIESNRMNSVQFGSNFLKI